MNGSFRNVKIKQYLKKSYLSVYLYLNCRSANRVAIVTGSLSGIGLGIANALAKRNYNIVLNGFTTQEDLEKV